MTPKFVILSLTFKTKLLINWVRDVEWIESEFLNSSSHRLDSVIDQFINSTVEHKNVHFDIVFPFT